ncbi:MAG: hypothetical protein ACJ71U_15360 [Terriglobales bacterium]
MAVNRIQVEQQCHGYKGGHQLLATSVKLVREDQDTIDRLSDISGALRPDERFSPYLTAYPLPSGEYYVLAKTWQDLDARRAGCVLTRSFLIRLGDWIHFEDVQGLIQRLKPVDRHNVLVEPFDMDSDNNRNIPPVNLCRTTELVEALFLEERQPIVVFGTTESDLIITRLLTAFWPGIKRNFSTCSFALGPRTVAGRPFDLVFSPKELRSRFAKWEGRRIDGSGERDPVMRHKWSAATSRRIFEDPSPALSRIDALGILSRDRTGDESRLRLALLWNDLVEQLKESPTAILGMLDILQSQTEDLSKYSHEINVAVSEAIKRSSGMEASKTLEFLVPLCNKLADTPIPLGIVLKLRRSIAQTTAGDVSAAIRLIASSLPNGKFITRILFAGIGAGIAKVPAQFLDEQLFSKLTDEHLMLLLAVSKQFSMELVGEEPASLDSLWIDRLAEALNFPASQLTKRAKSNITENLINEMQLPLLEACMREAHLSEVLRVLKALWKKSKLAIPAFDSVLLAAVKGRSELLELRNVTLAMPATSGTVRLLLSSLNACIEDFEWTIHERRVGHAIRSKMIGVLFEQSSATVLATLARKQDLLEDLQRNFDASVYSAAIYPYLKTLAWSDLDIDVVLSVALPLLQQIRSHSRSEILSIFIYKALRYSQRSSNESICHLISDEQFVVNPDYLVANAVSPESTATRISDNLLILNRSHPRVRREVLRYIDNLSLRVSQHQPEKLTDDGINSWSELIRDAGEINPVGQMRAAGTALAFALTQLKKNVSPLVVVSFPLVYRELKQGKETPLLWAIFFQDWDRCKAVRKELIESFIKSSWPPLDLLKASLPTGDLDRILGRLLKDERGSKYLKRLTTYIGELAPAEREKVEEAIRQAAPVSDLY